jgi:hypothetical protein
MQALPCALQALRLQLLKCAWLPWDVLLSLIMNVLWVRLGWHAAVCCIALLLQGLTATAPTNFS